MGLMAHLLRGSTRAAGEIVKAGLRQADARLEYAGNGKHSPSYQMRDARFEEDSLHNPYALIVPREFTQAQRSPMRLVDIVQANHTARPRSSPTLSGTRRPPGTRFSVTISFS